MNKERELEKTRISNYEILCIMRICTPEQKNSLVEKIEKSTPLENFTIKSEVRELAYPIEKMKTAEYLLLNFRAERRRISEIKEILKNPLVIRYLVVNLDTEKRIKIKNSDKLQKNKRFRKLEPRGEKSPQEKFSPESTNHAGVDN